MSEAHDEANDLFDFCLRYISFDGQLVPYEQRGWKIGQTYAWHYVKNVEYRTAQFIRAIEDMTMAPRGRKGQKYDAGSYVFVKCELAADDKKTAKIWIEENTAKLGEILHDVVASDYKFTVSFSPDHDTFTACLVGKEDNQINGKKTLTARHKDWVAAAMTVLYKHLVMFKAASWVSAASDEDDGWA